MGYVKKAAPHICAVLKGMLFIGFSIQIALGICWMGCNFGKVQGFGEPDSAWFGTLLGLLGGNSVILQLLQLALALFAGSLFLQKLRPAGAAFALWRGFALLTFPFALQCHLALQPYSLMSSLFLLMLVSLLGVDRKKAALHLAMAMTCGALLVAFSGIADRAERPGHSLEGAMVSRFAWPTLWSDFGWYAEEVTAATGEVIWEASLYPDGMKLFQETLERQVGEEAARTYYLEMAKTGWENHKPMVIRQIGWDVLGYAVTPVVFRLQMAGGAYDSYSGRNYEIMREKSPILTKYYVDYGCWWFVCAILLGLATGMAQAFDDSPGTGVAGWGGQSRKRRLASTAVCVGACGLLVAVLTMRGAGRMDYRCTIAVNVLWLAGSLLTMGRKRRERI